MRAQQRVLDLVGGERDAVRRERGVDGAHLALGVVRHADGLDQTGAVRRASAGRHRACRAQADRRRGSGRDGRTAARAARARRAASSSARPRTAMRHGNGMNLVATTTRSRWAASSRSRRPMMRSLSPLPYISAVSSSVTPARDRARRTRRGWSRSRSCGRSRPCPTSARSPQAQVPRPMSGKATSQPGSAIVWSGVTSAAPPRSGFARRRQDG